MKAAALFERPPAWFPLARSASLAVRASPATLRALRLRLHRELDAAAEADLWWSPLVQARGPFGVVFHPEVAERLRTELAGDRARLDAAWEVVAAAHRALPEVVRTEEELLWRQARGTPSDRAVAMTLLQRVVDTWRAAPPARGTWAAQALARLPGEVRTSPLGRAFSLAVGGLRGLEEVAEAGALAQLPWERVLPATDTAVDVAWEGGVLRFTRPAVTAARIEVPAAEGVVLTVHDGARTHEVHVPAVGAASLALEATRVEVRALDGRAWALSPTEREVSADLLDFDWARRLHTETVGRERIGNALVDWIRGGAAPEMPAWWAHWVSLPRVEGVGETAGVDGLGYLDSGYLDSGYLDSSYASPAGGHRASAPGRWLFLFGGDGAGKSALSFVLLEKLGGNACLHVFHAMQPAWMDVERAERSLCAQLRARIPGVDTDGLGLAELAGLVAARGGQPLVIVLDGLEYAAREHGDVLRRWFGERPPHGVVVVAAAGKGEPEWPEEVADGGMTAATLVERCRTLAEEPPHGWVSLDGGREDAELLQALAKWLGRGAPEGRGWGASEDGWAELAAPVIGVGGGIDLDALAGARKLIGWGAATPALMADPRTARFWEGVAEVLFDEPYAVQCLLRAALPLWHHATGFSPPTSGHSLLLAVWGVDGWLLTPRPAREALRMAEPDWSPPLAHVQLLDQMPEVPPDTPAGRYHALFGLAHRLEGTSGPLERTHVGPLPELVAGFARHRRIEALVQRLGLAGDRLPWIDPALPDILLERFDALTAAPEEAAALLHAGFVARGRGPGEAAELVGGWPDGLVLAEVSGGSGISWHGEEKRPPALAGFQATTWESGPGAVIDAWAADGRRWSWTGGPERPFSVDHFRSPMRRIAPDDAFPVTLDGTFAVPWRSGTVKVEPPADDVTALARHGLNGFFAGTSTGHIWHYDATAPTPVWHPLGTQHRPIRGLAAAGDSVLSIAGAGVHLWRAPTWEPHPLPPLPDPAHLVLAGPEGWLFALTRAGVLCWLDPERLTWKRSAGGVGRVTAYAWASEDGRHAIVTGNDRGEVYTLIADRSRRVPQLAWRHPAPVRVVATDAHGRIATGAVDGSIRALGARGEKAPRALDAHAAAVGGLHWLDGDLLSCGEDGRLLRWDVLSGALKADHRVGGDPVTAMDTGEDGSIWVGWAGGRVQRGGEPRGAFEAPVTALLADGPGCWAATADGRLSYRRSTESTPKVRQGLSHASGLAWGWDRSVVILDANGLTYSRDGLADRIDGPLRVEARPDSELAGGAPGADLEVWIHRDGRPRLTTRSPAGDPLPGHPGRARCIDAFDGLILSGTDDGSLVLHREFPVWERVLLVPRAHAAPITGCRIVRRDRLVTCSLDGTVRAWDPDGAPLGVFRAPGAFTRVTGPRNQLRPIVAGDWEGRLWTLELREPYVAGAR